jgi:hypothetical protein
MKQIPLTPEVEAISRRIVWFEQPVEALKITERFLAYAFAFASHDDMQTLKKYLDSEDLRIALNKAPPGIIDPRSWNYWHLMLGDYPPPSMPSRSAGF